MHRFRRPEEPDGFDEAVEDLRAAVAKRMAKKMRGAARRATRAAANGEKEDKSFVDAWKDYKAPFSSAQFRKCGYCELTVANQDGDVEHFAPKSWLQELDDDPASQGEEVAHLSQVRGRKPRLVSTLAYWWRAYEWDNYLLACRNCNSKWKRNLFPVQAAKRANPPTRASREKVLLINPFDGPAPAAHLHFTEIGAVQQKGRSRCGRETIKTCGLDRPSLREVREPIAAQTYETLRLIQGAKTSEETDAHLRALYKDGKDCVQLCGMVRAIVAAESRRLKLGITWNKIEKKFGSGGCNCAMHQAAAAVRPRSRNSAKGR